MVRNIMIRFDGSFARAVDEDEVTGSWGLVTNSDGVISALGSTTNLPLPTHGTSRNAYSELKNTRDASLRHFGMYSL
jgi:hypothetical protein